MLSVHRVLALEQILLSWRDAGVSAEYVAQHGSPERVIAQMKRYMHEAGATSFLHQMRIGGLEHKKVMRSMELYAKHVMPALREEEMRMKETAVVA